MKIRLLSDLHLEFGAPPPIGYLNEDVLVIAGDFHSGSVNVIKAMQHFYRQDRPIVYVPGNHEYYGTSIEEFDEAVTEAFSGTNVHFLNPGTVEIKGIEFRGAALWTNFHEKIHAQMMAKSMIADFKRIKGFSTKRAVELYEEHSEFLLKPTDVVVSHFLPDDCCIDPKFAKEGMLNHYFANQLADRSMAELWLFGHTHSKVDLQESNTRYVANPRGYPRENNCYEEVCINIGQ
jgi:predicted phosphodiesterase